MRILDFSARSSGFTHAHWPGWPSLSAKSDKILQVIWEKDKNNLMVPNLHDDI